MGPQQLDGERGTHLDDIYSVGATLYDLLTRKPPFYSGNIDRQIHERVPPSMTERRKDLNIEPASVAAIWEQAVAACLQKDPAKRPQSAMEVAHRLQLSSVPVPAKIVRRPVTWNAILWAGAAVLICLIGLGTWYFAKSKLRAKVATPAPNALTQAARITEKSIAVLPFENLSEEKANAFFADGVQDEILTDLARIADLKVISRTSVMQYKSGAARNLREVGQQLGVAHVVEGTVQRSGNRVRVNAQLIDARTDKQLWGQVYDRDLLDVFAIQSEIAKTIADQLQAKLSPSEEAAIKQPPTSDISGFDLYTRAKNLIATLATSSVGRKADRLQAIELLNQAVARDPSFFDAYCLLAWFHDDLYFFGFDHTPARLASAEAAIQAAFRLRPDAGEAHLARAWNLYHGYLDYDSALAECEIARQSLPNNSEVFELTAYIQRRQARWEESTRNLAHAIELDPRSVRALASIAGNYARVRRYAEAKSVGDGLLAIEPNDAAAKVARAFVEFDWKADTRPLHQTIDSIRTTNPAAMPTIANDWLFCALAERDAAAAKNALTALGENQLAFQQLNSIIRLPDSLSYGDLKLMPFWDPLRGDPRFEKILEESKNPVTLTTTLPPQKSIAVLPFENLSKDEENAFFAGGVQDEILNDLAKVADLKVISRTSVMKYKSGLERNLREIAKTLGVSHVVEGSVQRAGRRVRLNVQLIDARNDAHLWAEHYDRDFADVFAVQSEIAERIANQLRATLSVAEKAAIEDRPTADPVAYAYYTEAKAIGDRLDWEGWEKSGNRAIELLEKRSEEHTSELQSL